MARGAGSNVQSKRRRERASKGESEGERRSDDLRKKTSPRTIIGAPDGCTHGTPGADGPTYLPIPQRSCGQARSSTTWHTLGRSARVNAREQQ